MASFTRKVHVVRITAPLAPGQVADPNNPQPFVDVEVLDSVSLQTASGDEHKFEVMQNPAEVDDVFTDSTQGTTETGSGAEERLYDTNAGTANPYVKDETGDNNGVGNPLDCSRSSHMVRLTSKSDATQFLDVEVLDAFSMLGPNGSEVMLDMTGGVPFITDNTGSGLGNEYEASATTRAAHIVKVTPPPPTDGTTLDPKKFILVQRTDKVSFLAPNGNEFLIDISGADDDGGTTTNDTTNYTIDPKTGDQVPPANTDPDPYVVFPPGSKGPFLGADVPVNQGILWWIKKTGGTPSPGQWYWYIPVQQPKEFSFFGRPPENADPSWDPLGFAYLPSFSVIYILSANSPIVPIPQIGFASLEDAVNAGGAAPPNFLPDGNLNPNYGEFTLTLPPVPTSPDQTQMVVPNIWQLTGIAQPSLTNPSLPYNGSSNPYTQPNANLASEVVNAFLTLWNLTSTAADELEATWTGLDFNSDTRASSPPLWPWNLPQPWHTNFQAGYFFNFQAGLATGIFSGGIPLEVVGTASPQYLAIGQLDPNKWDTTVYPPVPKPPSSPPLGGG